MPEIQAAVAMPWAGAGARVQAAVAMPWDAAAARVQSLGGAYAPPPSPGGGTAVTPGDLRAATALAAATAYRQVHTQQLVDLRSGNALPVDSVSITLQDDSIFWQLSADGQDALFATLTTGEQPAVVQATIDGHVWRFIVESVSRPRSAESRRVQFGGRSVAAVADAPYSFPANYVLEAPTTAAQLAAGALLAAGVELDWKLGDWLIPAGAISLSGTPLDVVRAVAAAVGAVVTAHASELVITVESRYPVMPNEWAATVPDVQLHSRAVRTENHDRADQPAYTGVIVSGQQGGALGYARLAGTSGAELAALVSDPLLTDAAALLERARSTLAGGGTKALVTRLLPVRTGAGEPGVLRRGALVRCVDQPTGGGTEIWHGMVRSVSLRAQLPAVEQAVTLERFTRHIVEPDTSAPLELVGTIADQEGEVGAPFALDLTPYRTGGADPYAWARRAGTLPAGLAIVGESIAGTPTLAGTAADVRLRVTDSVSRMLDSNAFDIVVLPNHRLLELTFEDSPGNLICSSTGEAFTLFGGAAFDSDGFAGKCLDINGATSSSSRLVSQFRSLWDLTSATFDWVICGRVQATGFQVAGGSRIAQLIETPYVDAANLTVALGSVNSNTNLRLQFAHPLSVGFTVPCYVVFPYDTAWHFFAVGRVGNTLYASVDGSGIIGVDGGGDGGTSWTTHGSYRRPAGDRAIYVGNNTVSSGALRGRIDNLQIIRGTPFDFVAGFTPPAGLLP